MRTEQFKLDIQRYSKIHRANDSRWLPKKLCASYVQYISPSLARWFMSYVGETFGEKEKMRNIEKV